MKTKSNNNFIITVMIVLLVFVSITGCQNSDSNSSTLEEKLDSVLHEPGSMLSDDQSFAKALDITSAIINISDLHIKEDSGNGDVILQDSYTIDVSNRIVSFDQVEMFPGTYKKVDLTFRTGDSPTLNGYSIIITGHYVTANGRAIPFTLKSDYTKQIQLPLENNGVTVNENSMVSISIVFDANEWLSVVDFADAHITNGKIVIDNKNNASLLNVFEANLPSY